MRRGVIGIGLTALAFLAAWIWPRRDEGGRKEGKKRRKRSKKTATWIETLALA